MQTKNDQEKRSENPGSLFSSNPGSIRTRLTGPGWGFFLMMVCGFLMSVNFSNNLIFAMTFLLSGIALVGCWQTYWNVSGLNLEPWRCEPVFAGHDIRYQCGIENKSQRERFGLFICADSTKEIPEIEISKHDRAEVKRCTQNRGLKPPVPVGLQSRFPLGLFRSRLSLNNLPGCLVYPAPHGEEPLPQSFEKELAHLGRESDNFAEMRRYAPGDPLSRVSWKAWARTDELYTKEFDGAEGHPALWLRLDQVRAPGLENKISQLCRWILDAHGQNREYGLELPGVRISPGNDENHKRLCLKTLALFGEE
ncbi:MAG: DUF58 domain-containing protein [Candidatus Nitronauta litoralis]|uniref:DUF58 domain-containing protein n=1 Tax=Candidatus Nitronauta litoralis TaxID=2705533 RepID=A0A7T0G143_9BACT|nr:MAG: DUF58 domain-containing protein [Candidatus Nitronauta litoralis]